MNWRLEVVPVPVSDVNAALMFYQEGLGFNLDFDLDDQAGSATRVIQLTPPGSGCSIQIGPGRATMPPGSLKGLQLVVPDLLTARAELTARGVVVSPIVVFDDRGQQRLYQEGEDLNNVGVMYLEDPDGNSWTLQQITDRP
ncbi:VOC family protein (plasmid) [Deinococcus sp. KNUC1210]|uniref:VOC family protein n=1 Tax=Deinococcus sp. KNUC1210 TaxID=2917691 RepID=UPI001EF0547E|nr:VOC family protein [Deinococcus sp. KNUC1210]ULH13941.1 VOC family protein [Deinococcus sp. KNUC1210]